MLSMDDGVVLPYYETAVLRTPELLVEEPDLEVFRR